MKKTKAKRMYFLVMYNLSSVQKGIQAGHAALEYSQKYKNDKDYLDFVKNHKTFIVLDGGSSSDMKRHLNTLGCWNMKCAAFHEPDLNNSISAIACVLDEDTYESTEGCDTVGDFFKSFPLAR